jgi:hypothetical protein
MGSISEKGFGKDHIGVGALLGIQDGGRIVGEWMVEKYHAAVFSDRAEEIQEFWNEIKHGRMKPYEVLKAYNVLLNTGMTEMWDIIKGTVSTNHIFNATDTKIGIGDSATGAQATDTDLLAATNKTYQAMDSGWPKTHTDDGAIGAGAFQSKATFGTSDANYAWNEAVVKNTNAASLKCLCRSTTGWGTKTSAATWVATHTLTLS